MKEDIRMIKASDELFKEEGKNNRIISEKNVYNIK